MYWLENISGRKWKRFLTVDEMIEWLESAKRIAGGSGQAIGDYEVMLKGREVSYGGVGHTESSNIDLRVDNGRSVVYITKEQM